MMNVPVLLLLCVPTSDVWTFLLCLLENVYCCCKEFLIGIFAEFLCWGRAHYPGEFGVLEHPP